MDFKADLIRTLSAPNSGIANPQFDLEAMPTGKVAGFVVSKTFEGMPQLDRQHLIWSVLDKTFTPDQLLNIVTLITVTPDEASKED